MAKDHGTKRPARLNPENRYDAKDMVRQVAMMRASPLKVAAYQVRDPETLEWSQIQFHMTYDNTVMAVMGTEGAKLFARFVNDTLKPLAAPEPEHDAGED